jgi:mono/diheme cytochrome c family protein
MRKWIVWVGMFLGAGASGQPVSPPRGQLLYETHCIECHSTKMHWRDKRLVTDWPSLLSQVRRWQGEALLNWSDGDIEAVAGYLDDIIYRLPRPERRANLRASPGG